MSRSYRKTGVSATQNSHTLSKRKKAIKRWFNNKLRHRDDVFKGSEFRHVSGGTDVEAYRSLTRLPMDANLRGYTK